MRTSRFYLSLSLLPFFLPTFDSHFWYVSKLRSNLQDFLAYIIVTLWCRLTFLWLSYCNDMYLINYRGSGWREGLSLECCPQPLVAGLNYLRTQVETCGPSLFLLFPVSGLVQGWKVNLELFNAFFYFVFFSPCTLRFITWGPANLTNKRQKEKCTILWLFYVYGSSQKKWNSKKWLAQGLIYHFNKRRGVWASRDNQLWESD